MKKVILLGLTLAASSLTYGAYKYGQCQAIAKSTGKRCQNGVSHTGDLFCSQHKPR